MPGDICLMRMSAWQTYIIRLYCSKIGLALALAVLQARPAAGTTSATDHNLVVIGQCKYAMNRMLLKSASSWF